MKHTVLLLAALTLCSTAVRADDDEDQRFFPTEDEKNTPFFERGSWISTAHVAFYGPEDPNDRDIRMTLLNIGAERYLWKNVGVLADVHLITANGNITVGDNNGQIALDNFGAGGSLGLKWHFLRGESWSAYVGGSVGVLFTDGGFPPGGTSWNFMERADLGFTFRLKDQLHLIVSSSLIHASNGKGLNSGNPSFSGEGGYAGLAYRFDTLGIFDR